MNIEFEFRDYNTKLPKKYNVKTENSSIISFTFGKDSLLTLALCQELGIKTIPVAIEEKDTPIENKERNKLIKKFFAEHRIDVLRLKNETAFLHDWKFWNVPKTDWVFGQVLTEYCLELIPLAYYYKTRYIMFGNEQSCNDFYFTDEGFKCYPVADQSHKFMKDYDTIANMLSQNKVRCTSLVEPLNELAVIKVLHNRYPDIGKYQMSCFPDDFQGIKKTRWCQHCSKCARMFIFLKAHNTDVKKIGFNKNLLNKEFIKYYSIFGGDKNMLNYDKSEMNKQEMLFAFYLAYKNKAKGQLMNIFKEKYLEDVKKREDELYKKFYGIHNPITIPKKLKQNIISIFKEELK